MDDVTLIRDIAQAKPEALGALYDRYSRLVFSLAYAIIADRAVAEEITQDVFIRVWQRASTYRPEQAQVSTWLTAVTRHHAIDVLRRRNARPEAHSVGWDDLPPQALTAHDLEDHAEQSLLRERLRAALAALPADQQQALALAFLHGYTQPQIAELLRQPLGTIKTRVRAAMQKLRQKLLAEQPFDDPSARAAGAYRKEQNE
jgi:RNA polymerase sigma-70 factor (ECF subfamily)